MYGTSFVKADFNTFFASPGGFKIYVLLFIGFLSSKVQGDLANDLSIVGFLTMITAIGAGTQLLHLIPKK